MATWITKPWIENALSADSLPKIAKAQVLKLEQTSNNSAIIAIISDKKLFVKARFSPTAIEEFERDTCNTSLAEIQGGLIFVKKYSVSATAEVELDQAEFVINIDHFKFAGGEGNTQFGTDLVDSSTLPQLQSRLRQLWRIGQLRIQFDDAQEEANFPDTKKTKRLLLKSHDSVYIPKDMERKLAEIAEWKPSYCPPHTCTSEIQSCSSSTQMQICAESAESAERETEEKEIEKHTCMSQEHNEKRRLSTKRKRSQTDDSVRKTRSSGGVKQENKLLLPDSPVSPDSTSCSVKSSSQSGSSQSQRSNHSISMAGLEDLYSQQDGLFLDTSGSTGSHKSPQEHCSTSPSILGNAIEEPCSLSTPNFDSLPSYQVPAGDKGTPSNVIFLSPMARDRRGELSAENKRNRLNVTSPPMTSDQGDELLPCSTSRTRKREAENHQEPGTSWNFVEKALKTGSSKQKRKTKARRKFNWFSDAY
ncbi:uncharacterized protein LOC144649723 isoform X3 [Oculina patagonica]